MPGPADDAAAADAGGWWCGVQASVLWSVLAAACAASGLLQACCGLAARQVHGARPPACIRDGPHPLLSDCVAGEPQRPEGEEGAEGGGASTDPRDDSGDQPEGGAEQQGQAASASRNDGGSGSVAGAGGEGGHDSQANRRDPLEELEEDEVGAWGGRAQRPSGLELKGLVVGRLRAPEECGWQVEGARGGWLAG